MIVGKIALPQHIDVGAKLGGHGDAVASRVPRLGAPEGFVATLRRRAGGDADSRSLGNDRAPHVRDAAQEATSQAEDTDQQRPDVAAEPSRDQSDAGPDTTDRAPESDPSQPTDESETDTPTRGNSTEVEETTDTHTPSEADESDRSPGVHKEQKDTKAAPAENAPAQQRLRPKAEVIDSPRPNDTPDEPAPATARKGDASSSETQGAGDKGPTPPTDPGNVAARTRARERARLHWESSHSNKDASNAADASATKDSGNAGAASKPGATDDSTAKRSGLADQATTQPVLTPDAAGNRSERVPTHGGTPKDSASPSAHTTESSARLSDAHNQSDTAKDQPDERQTGAQTVRPHADSSGAPKAQPQSEALFRLTLDNAADATPKGVHTAKAGDGAPRAAGAAMSADRAFSAGLTRGISAVLNQKGGALTMRLTPPSLGHVRIVMALKGGQVSVELEAGNARAHDLLRSQLPALRQSLEAKGLTVERLGVQLSANAHQGHAGSGGDHQSGATGGGGNAGGRPEDAGAQHDAGDGRSRGARDGNPDAHDGGRGGDPDPSAFEQVFGGLAGESDGLEASGVRLGLDAVI